MRDAFFNKRKQSIESLLSKRVRGQRKKFETLTWPTDTYHVTNWTLWLTTSRKFFSLVTNQLSSRFLFSSNDIIVVSKSYLILPPLHQSKRAKELRRKKKNWISISILTMLQLLKVIKEIRYIDYPIFHAKIANFSF